MNRQNSMIAVFVCPLLMLLTLGCAVASQKTIFVVFLLPFVYCFMEGLAGLGIIKKKQLKNNRKGVLFVYLVIIAAIVIGGVIALFFMTAVGAIQETIHPVLQDKYVVSESYYNAFGLAVAFVTNIWKFLLLIVLFVLAYWVYIYQQRSNVA